MSNLIHIAERVLNTPLLVHPDKLPLILSVLEGRIPIDGAVIGDLRERAEAHIAELPEDARAALLAPTPDASRFSGSWVAEDPATGRATSLPYARTREGVAVVSIIGGLANRGTSLTGGSMSRQSYEAIKFQLAHAKDDPNTAALILDMQTPGGEAVGAFEAADAVRAVAAVKPVFAVVNGMAASAGYALASAASKIVTTPSGVSGSIGVVLLHADYSRQLDKEGVTATLIHAGAHKVDGNPFQPLTKAVRADLQAEIDQIYEMFVATVAKGRHGMSLDAIRATEARTFMGADAVSAGLADEVGTFEDVLAELNRGAGRATHAKPGGFRMANEKSAPAADVNAGIPKADHDAAVTAARAEGHAAGVAEGRKAGATDERARIGAIVGLEEATGREKQAMTIATTTDLSADQAKAILAATPKATAAASAARAGDAPIGIVLDGGKNAPGATAASVWDEVVAETNAKTKRAR